MAHDLTFHEYLKADISIKNLIILLFKVLGGEGEKNVKSLVKQ